MHYFRTTKQDPAELALLERINPRLADARRKAAHRMLRIAA